SERLVLNVADFIQFLIRVKRPGTLPLPGLVLVQTCDPGCSAVDHYIDPVAVPWRAVRTGAHPVDVHAGLFQCVDDAMRIALARTVDRDLGRRVLPHVVRDVLHLARVGPQNVIAAPGEREAPERGHVAGCRVHLAALRTGLADQALGTGGAGCTGGAGDASHLGVAPRANESGQSLRACRACRANRSGRTFARRAFGTAAAGDALHAGQAGCARRT